MRVLPPGVVETEVMRRGAYDHQIHPWMSSARGLIIGPLLLLLSLSSCEIASPEASCSGAAGIDSLHAEQLACVGWLGYVERHICRIDYVDIIPPEQHNTAIKARGYILSAC